MKIALVFDDDLTRFGGVQEQLFGLARFLVSKGEKVTIISCGRYPKKLKSENKIISFGKLLPIIWNDSSTSLQLVFGQKEKIENFLEKEDFDIIHFQGFPAFLSQQILRASQATHVLTFFSYMPDGPALWFGKSFIKPLFKILNKSFHERVAVSQSARDFAWQFFPGRFKIIPPGIDYNFFKQGKAIKKFKDGKLNILYVGRFEKRKGVPYLLSAYRNLKSNFSNCRLLLVGNGPEREEVKEEVKEKKIKEVVFCGAVSKEKLKDYYATADIFCSPATHGESFGIVLIEAMASGLPIVAFDIIGYKEAFPSYQKAFLVQPRSVGGLTEAFFVLNHHRGLRTHLANKNKKEAQKYDWSIIGERIRNFYYQVKEKHPKGKKLNLNLLKRAVDLLKKEEKAYKRRFKKYLKDLNRVWQ